MCFYEKRADVKISFGKVDVVTYLHIRDSIFWIAVKLVLRLVKINSS